MNLSFVFAALPLLPLLPSFPHPNLGGQRLLLPFLPLESSLPIQMPDRTRERDSRSVGQVGDVRRITTARARLSRLRVRTTSE